MINQIATTHDQLSPESLEQILEEIAGYDITLVEDPTLPHLGLKYLQQTLAQCRNYLNRVQYYFQLIRRHEKDLRIKSKLMEMDIEFKMKEKLADDQLVRKQPSIEDRKALASTMLQDEFQALALVRGQLVDVEESAKLVKGRLEHLRQTSGDIKIQRQMVREDMMAQMAGDEGYDRPQVKQDRTVPGGMAAPVSAASLNPTDLLDPKSRPEDMPEPIDGAHAELLANFYNKQQAPKSPAPGPSKTEEKPVQTVGSFEDLLG
jgi:hypothetical protein